MENRVKIWVGSKTATKVGVWCIPRPNFYQNISTGVPNKNLQDMATKTQLEAQKADTEKNVLFQELDANKDKLWFNVKCAYTIIDKKQYLVLHQKDLSAEKKQESVMKVHNYLKTEEIDFPFRDFNSNNKIIISNGGVTSKNIFLKAITVFIDFIPVTAKYEYFT